MACTECFTNYTNFDKAFPQGLPPTVKVSAVLWFLVGILSLTSLSICSKANTNFRTSEMGSSHLLDSIPTCHKVPMDGERVGDDYDILQILKSSPAGFDTPYRQAPIR